MTILRVHTAAVFQPLLVPARYKGVWGGRGSGKSHFFADLLVEDSVRAPGESGGEGLLSVCIREVQRTLAQSSKRLIEKKIQEMGVGSEFRVWRDRIETPGDGLMIFQGMQDHTAESIKSLEGFRRAWVEEAQSLSARSLALLRPTIRAKNSELWASWNPRRKSDAIDDFLRQRKPDGSVVIRANWQDNPWFPAELEAERKLDLSLYPERYEHTWEGAYATAFEGAYFAGVLASARAQNRIVPNLAQDPLLPLRVYIDIGGAGANADAFTMWVVQFVGDEIRVLDYYEAVGQVLGAHVAWLRKRGYGEALLFLPHDGVNANTITGKRYEDHLREAGFDVTTIPNQGRGAAAMRIEAVRRLSPKFRFHEQNTEPGRDALGFYHERKDEARNVGLGPEHDWSSHGADSFGLMACAYEEPARSANFNRPLKYAEKGWR